MSFEDEVAEYYEDYWPKFVQWWESDETLGLHHGYYEDGIKNFKEASLNMNNYIGKLLHLEENSSMQILDAGCGVGGTSIYLAQKYEKSNFTGVTITPGQIKLAKSFSKQRNAHNTEFLLQNFLDTKFPDNSFNGIISLESIAYVQNVEDFIGEMHRVLIPGGRLVIIDGFYNILPKHLAMKKINKYLCKAREISQIFLLDDLNKLLVKQGFGQIEINNITKNIRPSATRAFIIGLPFLISLIIKKCLSFGRYKPEKDFNLFMGGSVLSSIVGLSGSAGYYAITAVRK